MYLSGFINFKLHKELRERKREREKNNNILIQTFTL